MALSRRISIGISATAAVLAVAACGSSAKPASAPAPLAVSAGWPVALHDAAHSGTGAEVGPQSGALLWTRNLGGPISGGPAVSSDGTIYAFSNSGVLHALNPQTGADIWTYDGGGSANNNQDLSTTPAVLSDGSILWPGPRSTLFALSASGHLEWTFALRGTVLSPAVANGRVYVADSMGDLVALEASATSVTKMWELSIGTTSFGSPAVAPGGTVYGTADRSLVAIKDDGTRGRILWRFTDGADIEVSPSVAPAGTVVLGTNDSYEYGISPKGTVEWRYLRKVYSYSTPAVTPDGLAYFGDNNGYVDVVKAATGRVVGRYDGTARPLSNVGVGVWTAPLIDRHHDVYFGTAAGHVFGFTYSGAKLFDLSTGATVDSYPALTPQGTLIIGSDNGTLYAIG